MKKIFILLGLVLVTACTNIDLTQKVVACRYPDAPKESAPLWICGAAVEGVAVSAVGATPKSKAGVNFMVQQASANARVILAQQISSEVQSMVKNFTETTGTADAETVDMVNTLASKVITVQTLSGTKIIKQDTSPEGTLYVLVGFADRAMYKDYVGKSLNDSYGNQQATWQKVLAEKSFDELKKEVDKSLNK